MKQSHDEMVKRIINHADNLVKLFSLPADTDRYSLCSKLFRRENVAHRLSEDYCNGVIDSGEYEKASAQIMKSVDAILGFTAKNIPVFHNGDARGYALKVDDQFMRENPELTSGFYTDWGGYGIIAPDFREVR